MNTTRPDIQDERRVKALRIPTRFVVLELLRVVTKGTPDFVHLLDYPEIPEGTKVVAGPFPSVGGMHFILHLHHPSFPEVPDYEEPPNILGSCSYRAVALATRVSEEGVKQWLVERFEELGVSSVNRRDHANRWSATDFATDLAPILAETLNQGIPSPQPTLGVDPASGKDKQHLTAVWVDLEGKIIKVEDK